MLIRTTEHHQQVFEGSPSRRKTTKIIEITIALMMPEARQQT
jgi:hypothetical protein